ncbi:hypothetical protein ASE86_11210 [Sphingomonas sp. Leaf33]|uniref:hypothetical protein n=1 Tax=Sphingomonas sp. Leaf33 TaxID=1736215 RepID=UPI0006FF881E|nr:hypothetical protein [Sphingomonas sp. Leaf33]KQN26634.1 hypothetical protein ASE86_11210 [Sphingomonas sp. Leaf33]
MDDDLIPVVLDFIGVAPDASLSIDITSPGLAWSLGRRSGAGLGASYNVVPDGLATNESCIQEWAFTDRSLMIRTAIDAAPRTSFTIGLFLRRHDLTDAFMGYCTLNDGASVRVRFGDQSPVEWRDGRISAALEPIAERSSRVMLTMRGVRPGAVIDIDLAARNGEVAWTLGPTFADTQGMEVTSTGAGLPLSLFSCTPHRLKLVTQGSNDTERRDVTVLAYVSWIPASLELIHLRADSSAGVDIYAQVGNRQPQFVSQTFTLFAL